MEQLLFSELSGLLDPQAKYFVSLDLTSCYYQIKVDEESSNLLVIATLMSRFEFTVLAQGICSSSYIFNHLTDGSMCHDNSEHLENMDNVLLSGRTINELKEKLENVLEFCRKKNLKLKSSKLKISEQVEFGGALISSELVKK